MCSNCRDREPGRRFAVDGTTDVLCGPCLREDVQIGWAHERVRQIHRAAHGYDAPCPTCAGDPWLEAQRQAEAVEMALERSLVQATFTDDLDIRYPWR